ncbi:MAG: M28 family peptidase [Bacteroidota bacterium]
MKRTLLIISALLIFINLYANELVLIRTNSFQEVKSLSGNGLLTMNYLGNGFVIATKHGEIDMDYTLLDDNAWTKDHAYLLVFAEETRNETYRKEIGIQTSILYQNKELLFIKAGVNQLVLIQPPTDGSMVRIWNQVAELPDNDNYLMKSKLAADPFIVARMAEVNTTLMQSNVQHLQDYGTRNAYSAQGVLAQNWIKQQFESYGLSTTLFDFTMPSGSASDNVIATKTGSLYPNEYVIIGGHYDSYTGSSSNPAPGADDNASGTSGVLEIARILSPYTFDRTIIFCAFSGEEYGLYGSEAYAASCDALNMNILGYLNMDMIGYLKSGDPIHTDVIAPSSAQSLVDYYTNVVNLYLPAFTIAPGALAGGDSDHTSFNNHGFMGIFPFEDSQDYSPYIHTVNDVIGQSVNNFEQVGVFTKAILATAVSLANMIPPQNVSVSGTITDFNTGLPIQGATVQVVNSSVSSVTTNASGQYTIGSILTGIYNFRISKVGYATVYQTISVTTADIVFNFQLQESSAWSFETGAFEASWTFGGNAPWTISTESPYDGLYCSKSGVTGHSQSSEKSIQLYLNSAGTISFFRKVSSESGYDYLKFYIDNVQQGLWSGTIAWGEVSFTVTAGQHTFKWSYTKDANTVSGSDCAWVDYIIFPPIAPIPDPANISVTPPLLSKTVGLSGTSTDTFTISNTGEMDLTFSAQVMYNGSAGRASATVYPLSAGYNTGSTTTSAKTQTSLIKGYPTTEAGWMKFDLSSIPDGSTINSVEFHGYVNAANYPYWNINPVTNDPLTASSSVLYSDIMAESSSGYYLYQSESSTYTTGWKVHTLGGNANANLQAALTQNWFTIGIMDRDASSSYYIGFDGWNEANKPYLVVNYTYVPAYTWLKVNGSGSVSGTVTAGNSQQITVGFDAGTLGVGVYTANIQISSNDPDQPQVLIPCTLTVSSNRNLNLTVMLEGLYIGAGAMRKAQDASGDHFAGTTADQIAVELHDAANYNTIVYSVPDANLSTTGAVAITVPASHSSSYYITIKHRNSIETTTAAPVSFAGATINYSFDGPAKAYGGNLIQMSGGVYAIYGGDVNQDGLLDAGDMAPVDNLSASASSGYLPEDANGDGLIDSSDMAVVDNNSSMAVGVAKP